jgi:GDPmannose 4,6-dehydratase
VSKSAKVVLGDASKARDKLGWHPKTSFDALVRDMMEADTVAILKEQERRNRYS